MRLRTRSILLAFARREDAENIRRILARRSWFPAAVCNSGAQTLSAMEDLGECVVVMGYRLSDMIFSELSEDLPEGATILLIANPSRVEEVPDNVVFMPTPLSPQEFLSTMELLTQGIVPGKHSRKGSRSERTKEEQTVIDEAKSLLMERHHMSEPEAHRYLQRRAMENGCDLVETAQMVLALN